MDMVKNDNKANFQILFGKRVKELRKTRDLSLREVSHRCNLDYSDIAKYEKGEVNIQLSTIYELAKGLQVSPKDFFDFDFNFHTD